MFENAQLGIGRRGYEPQSRRSCTTMKAVVEVGRTVGEKEDDEWQGCSMIEARQLEAVIG